MFEAMLSYRNQAGARALPRIRRWKQRISSSLPRREATHDTKRNETKRHEPIRTDPTEVYGDGLRDALAAYQKHGLAAVFAHVKQTGELPR